MPRRARAPRSAPPAPRVGTVGAAAARRAPLRSRARARRAPSARRASPASAVAMTAASCRRAPASSSASSAPTWSGSTASAWPRSWRSRRRRAAGDPPAAGPAPPADRRACVPRAPPRRRRPGHASAATAYASASSCQCPPRASKRRSAHSVTAQRRIGGERPSGRRARPVRSPALHEPRRPRAAGPRGGTGSGGRRGLPLEERAIGGAIELGGLDDRLPHLDDVGNLDLAFVRRRGLGHGRRARRFDRLRRARHPSWAAGGYWAELSAEACGGGCSASPVSSSSSISTSSSSSPSGPGAMPCGPVGHYRYPWIIVSIGHGPVANRHDSASRGALCRICSFPSIFATAYPPIRRCSRSPRDGASRTRRASTVFAIVMTDRPPRRQDRRPPRPRGRRQGAVLRGSRPGRAAPRRDPRAGPVRGRRANPAAAGPVPGRRRRGPSWARRWRRASAARSPPAPTSELGEAATPLADGVGRVFVRRWRRRPFVVPSPRSGRARTAGRRDPARRGRARRSRQRRRRGRGDRLRARRQSVGVVELASEVDEHAAAALASILIVVDPALGEAALAKLTAAAPPGVDRRRRGRGGAGDRDVGPAHPDQRWAARRRDRPGRRAAASAWCAGTAGRGERPRRRACPRTCCCRRRPPGPPLAPGRGDRRAGREPAVRSPARPPRSRAREHRRLPARAAARARGLRPGPRRRARAGAGRSRWPIADRQRPCHRGARRDARTSRARCSARWPRARRAPSASAARTSPASTFTRSVRRWRPASSASARIWCSRARARTTRAWARSPPRPRATSASSYVSGVEELAAPRGAARRRGRRARRRSKAPPARRAARGAGDRRRAARPARGASERTGNPSDVELLTLRRSRGDRRPPSDRAARQARAGVARHRRGQRRPTRSSPR